MLYYYPILIYFLCIPASAADAAAVSRKGINTLLANGLRTFFIKGSPVFSNGLSFLIIEFLIIWYHMISDLQKLYKDLKLVY